MKKFILLGLFAISAQASDISFGTGESKFSDLKHKRDACTIAENNAVNDALIKFAGREFTVNDEMFCVDTKQHAYCNYIKEIDSSTSGTVRSVLDRIQRTEKDVCIVEVKVEIERARQYEASVDTKRIYKPGEKIKVDVKVKEPLYLNIFNLHKKGVDLLFPNDYNKNTLIDDRFIFPGKDINVIASLDSSEDLSNETLLFLFTKRRQEFVSGDVTKETLKEILKSIPTFEKKLITHNFIIKRGEK